VTAWLTANALFANDNCPENALLTDLSIRKPQQFKPDPGKMLEWRVRDIANNQLIQAGQTTVSPDGLVIVPQIFVTKETFRKIRIQIYDPSVATQEAAEDLSRLAVFPNPTNGLLFLKNEPETLRVFDLHGKTVVEKQGQKLEYLDVSSLSSGLYILEMVADSQRKVVRFFKN
jgi:Secretion system C-terminal sorting domain